MNAKWVYSHQPLAEYHHVHACNYIEYASYIIQHGIHAYKYIPSSNLYELPHQSVMVFVAYTVHEYAMLNIDISIYSECYN